MAGTLFQNFLSKPKSAPAPSAPTGSGIGTKKNILGQPIVAEAPTVAAAPKSLAAGGLARLQGGTTGTLALENAKLQAGVDAENASPRSQAAKLMKRQAGIGQLKTMHVEDTL